MMGTSEARHIDLGDWDTMGAPSQAIPQEDRMKSFEYKGWNLFDAMDAIMAYDEGAVDSGVADEAMRDAVIKFLKSLDKPERRKVCAEFARNLLTDESLAQGYSLADVMAFAGWLSNLGISVN
jgi:hypothetical protein